MYVELGSTGDMLANSSHFLPQGLYTSARKRHVRRKLLFFVIIPMKRIDKSHNGNVYMCT